MRSNTNKQDASSVEAFEAFVSDVLEPLRRYAFRRTDPETASEVVNDTLLVCWRKLSTIPVEPLPWVYGVAHKLLANRYRAQARYTRLVHKAGAAISAQGQNAAPDPLGVVVRDNTEEAIWTAIKELDHKSTEVLLLWGWEQLEPREIAQVLGISANAAAIRLHRAKEKLGRLLTANPAFQTGKKSSQAGHVLSEGGNNAKEHQ